ncbi:MAG: hypothetical protein GF344_11100 [Chitinivibrionales bacterium]|nr:hypothetical protein [Chitinivibrionales bacterium]
MVTQTDNAPGQRVFFPASIVNAHTGFDLVSKNRWATRFIWRNVPLPFPMMDEVDLAWAENWPIDRGVFANKIEGTWMASHSVTHKRGYVRVFGRNPVGIKYFGNQYMVEFFTGVSRNLSTYRVFEPQESATLRERIIPTIGMSWVTDASLNGVLGIYRTSDSLCIEYLIADTTGLGGDSLQLSVGGERSLLARSTVPWIPGTTVQMAIPSEKCGEKVSLKVQTTDKRSPRILRRGFRLRHHPTVLHDRILVPDTIPLLDTALLREPPIEEIIATQGSSMIPKTAPNDSVTKKPWKRADTTIGMHHNCVFQFPMRTRKDQSAPKIHVRTKGLRKVSAAVRTNDRTFILDEGALYIYRQIKERDDGMCPFGYPSIYPSRIDSCYAGLIERTKQPTGDTKWLGDLLLHNNKLVVALGKRLEVRDSLGEPLDTIILNDYPASLATLDEQNVLVVLPFKHALMSVNLADGQKEIIPLGIPDFHYPLGIAAVPGGFVVSSAVSKKLIFVSDNLREQRHFAELPSDVLRYQFPGIQAVAWHSKLQCLLVECHEQLGILKVGPDGKLLGRFGTAGPQDHELIHVTDISVDDAGNVLAPTLHARHHKRAQVKLYSQEGMFLGTLGNRYTAHRNSLSFVYPFDENKIIGVHRQYNSITVADSLGYFVSAQSAYGWKPSLIIQPCGGDFDRRFGYFLADGEKGVVHQFSPELAFVAELDIPEEPFKLFPVGLSLDNTGNLHVLSSNENGVALFVPTGRSEPGTTRYAYAKTYHLPGRRACAQRIYRQNELIVVVDISGSKAYRFDSQGTFRDSLALPDTLVPGFMDVTGQDGALHIKAMNRSKLIRISPRGSISVLAPKRFPFTAKALISLDQYPGWLPGERPADAHYAAILHGTANHRAYLDKTFSVISSSQAVAFDGSKAEAFGIVGDTKVIFCKDFEGVWKLEKGSKTPTPMPIPLPSSKIRLIRGKTDSTFGMITDLPLHYIECTLDGEILTQFPVQGTRRIYNFSIADNGDIVLPFFDMHTVQIYSFSGELIREVDLTTIDRKFGFRFTEAARFGPDGRLYVSDWESGQIAAIDERDGISLIFGGEVENIKNGINHMPWFHFIGDSLIVTAKAGAGEVHLIGLDGKHYGTLPNPKEWRWNIWHGVRASRNSIAFMSQKGIWEITIDR